MITGTKMSLRRKHKKEKETIIRHDCGQGKLFLKFLKIPETIGNHPKLHENQRIGGILRQKFPGIRNFLSQTLACIISIEFLIRLLILCH